MNTEAIIEHWTSHQRNLMLIVVIILLSQLFQARTLFVLKLFVEYSLRCCLHRCIYGCPFLKSVYNLKSYFWKNSMNL